MSDRIFVGSHPTAVSRHDTAVSSTPSSYACEIGLYSGMGEVHKAPSLARMHQETSLGGTDA